jgi:hypothetical protein
MRLNARLHGIAISVYMLVALLVIYPLWMNNGTHAAGYDFFHFHWNFWWVETALSSPELSVFQSDYVMFPFENNMAYTTLSLFWYPLWAVVEAITDTFTAMTVITFVAIVLQGYAFFVYLRHEQITPMLALLGGLVLQATPLLRYFYYNTHINLIGWFWLPVHLLLWKQVAASIEVGKWRHTVGWAVLQAVGLWAMILTDLQFPLLLGFLLIPYGLLTVWRGTKRLVMLAVGSGIVSGALALLWGVGLLPAILDGVAGTIPGVVEDRPGIPFPGGFLWTYDRWWEWNVPTLGGFVAFAVVSALLITLFWRKPSPIHRHRWLWFALMLPPLVIAIGPTLTLFGTDIAMPYRWLFDVTDGNFRMPWRIAPVYLIAGFIFAAKTWSPVVDSLSLNVRAPLMAASVLVLAFTLRLYMPGPVQPVLPEYDFYTTIASEPDRDYVIIDAPTGAGTGELLVGNMDAIATQYYAIIHQRKVINGFLARAPLGHFWYLRTDDPLLSWLGQRRELEPEAVEAQLREIIPSWPVGYIVLHKNFINDPNGEAAREIMGYFNGLHDVLCPVFIEGEAVVYRTSWHPDGCPARLPVEIAPNTYQIDIGTSDDQRFIGWGWYWMESFGGLTARWTGEGDHLAALYLDLPVASYTVTVTMQAFGRAYPVTLSVNGRQVGRVEVSAETIADYTFVLPPDLTGDNLTLTLTYPDAERQVSGERALGLLIDRLIFMADD